VKCYEPSAIARDAQSFNPRKPAMALIHDTDDARLVVFRIAPGQAVERHVTRSTVVMHVLSGAGVVSGGDEERAVEPGMTLTFVPGEAHGMRADDQELVLLATITPRPGTR
jgi:quercetin dioxygenase-like cupin family protein